MMKAITPQARPLYIIAPDLMGCRRTALAFGLNPETMVNVRTITSAYQLRGTRAGTPFITHDRTHWVMAMRGVFELDQAIDLMVRTGRLRPAGTDDITAAHGEEMEDAR